MKYKWLSKKQNNENLLYFFNGWGMDESVLNTSNISSCFDVLMLYDYQNLDMDENVFVECQKYKNKYVISRNELSEWMAYKEQEEKEEQRKWLISTGVVIIIAVIMIMVLVGVTRI